MIMPGLELTPATRTLEDEPGYTVNPRLAQATE